MKSTGEVMGLDMDLGVAFYKSQLAAGTKLPMEGKVFISVKDRDKPKVVEIAREFHDLGFLLYATEGTAKALVEAEIPVNKLLKVSEGRPNVLDMIKNGEIDIVINTPAGRNPRLDEVKIRTAAMGHRVATMTTLRAAKQSAAAIRSLKAGSLDVQPLQDYQAG